MIRTHSESLRYALSGLLFAAASATMSMPASADPVSAQAFMTAEIRTSGAPSTDTVNQPSGIRQFSNDTSTLFFNVEGSGNGNFQTFAVADFRLPTMAGTTGVTGATLSLFEAPAAFAVAGPIGVYLLGVTDPNLVSVPNNPVAGTPSYQSGQNGLASIDPVFQPFATALGSATFTPTAAGTATTVQLNFAGSTLSTLLSAINSGGLLRLGVAPGNASVAATFAGLGNNSGPPPTLAFNTITANPIPEPTSVALLGIGALGLGVVSRSRGRRLAA